MRRFNLVQRFTGALLCLCVLLMAAALTSCGKDKTPTEKGDKSDKNPGSYSYRKYSISEGGERTLTETFELDTDEEGRVIRDQTVRIDSEGGERKETYRYEYDSHGRRVKMEIKIEVPEETLFSYNTSGFITIEYDGDSERETLRTYHDDDGNVTAAEKSVYNEDGKLVSYRYLNPNGEVMSFEEHEYDAFGNAIRVVQMEGSEEPVVLVEYDPAERKITRYDSLVHYMYETPAGDPMLRVKDSEEYLDRAGRVIRRVKYEWTNDPYEEPYAYEVLEFEYDADSPICTKSTAYSADGAKKWSMEYDSYGRCKRALLSDGDLIDVLELVFDWEATDPRLPGQTILCAQEYRLDPGYGGLYKPLSNEIRYLVKQTGKSVSSPLNDMFDVYYQCYTCMKDDMGVIRLPSVYVDSRGILEVTEYSDVRSPGLEYESIWKETFFDEQGNRVKEIRYYSDKRESEFDSHGNLVKEVVTNEDGTVKEQSEWEYTYYDEEPEDK